MDNTFIQLALILGIASILGYIFLRFKLPLLVAYLLGGLLLASWELFDVHASRVLNFLPDIGIAFVLFLVGMELDLREVRNLGKPILFAGLTQVIITSFAGSAVARFFGFGQLESWFLGAGLAFSSTILITKILADKKDLTALYGKLVLGVLIFEDLIAVAILLWLTVSSSMLGLGYQQAYPFLTFIAKVIILFGLTIFLSKIVLPTVFKAVSKQGELLFLTALAFLFIYISFSIFLGFSVVIGAFLAGLALASSPYHFQIQGKIKPLRDFFVALFFVYLGTKVNFSSAFSVYPVIIFFSIYAILMKPFIFILLWSLLGFKKHTVFKTAINTTQISEFSLIILLAGTKSNLVSENALTIIAFSSVISMIASSILITRGSYIYKQIKSLVGFFEKRNHHSALEVEPNKHSEGHVIVIGGHRMGGEIVRFLQKEKVPHLVLDFNPNQVDALLKEDINAIYGDMGDPEILDGLNFEVSKMVISTAQDLEDNLLLLEELKSRGVNIPVVVRAETTEDAKVLYKRGADFVIIPEVVAGDLITKELKEHLRNADYFNGRSKIEMERLQRKTLAWE